MIRDIAQIIALACRLNINTQIVTILFGIMGYVYENPDIRLRHILFLIITISMANIFGTLLYSLFNRQTEANELHIAIHKQYHLFSKIALCFLPIFLLGFYYLPSNGKIVIGIVALAANIYRSIADDNWLVAAILLSIISASASLIGSSLRMAHMPTLANAGIHFGIFAAACCFIFMINVVREYETYESDLQKHIHSSAMFFEKNSSIVYIMICTSFLIYITFASAFLYMLALAAELWATTKLNLCDTDSCRSWIMMQNYVVALLLLGLF